jgi:adenylate kinase
MRLVLLGPPGAGKGTHAQVLSKEHKLAHISTGDMLREALRAQTPLGLKAKEYMDKGGLVPDEVVIGIVKERLKKDDAQAGFILDGFPRTVEQAESLDKMLAELKMPLDIALYFKTTVGVIIRRLSGRRVCSKCGRTYHMTNFRPKAEGVCDDCQGPLIQRADDHEDVIAKRLEAYEKQTSPLIAYYDKKKVLAEVSGDLEVEPLNRVLTELFQKKGLAVRSRA